MTRDRCTSEEAARAELGAGRTQPPWLGVQHALPFNDLSPEEFEIVCFLLLWREHPGEEVFYYGKTGDAGRDIVHRAADGMRLVQCKRLGRNVGIGDVRAELAKLCTNIHRKVIPEAPTRICFYASEDFTAEAQDLLESQSQWLKAAEKALTDHLKGPPEADLLAFARSWWPTFERQNALALTERLKRHNDLLEEFFSVRKVVDARALDPLTSTVSNLERKIDLQLQIQQADTFEKLRLLVQEAEAKNPDVEIRVEVTKHGPVFCLTARASGGPAQAGRLSFPDTPAGQNGRAKFEQMKETGRGVELLSGEFIWEPTIPLLGVDAQPDAVTSLQLKPRLPNVHVPVRLDCRRDGTTVESLPFATLRLVRYGTKELEIDLQATRYDATFHLALTWHAPSTASSQFDLTSTRASDALQLARFMSAMLEEGASLVVSSLERGTALFELRGIRFELSEEFANSRVLLEHLDVINRALGTDFRHPKGVDPLDAKHAEILAIIIGGAAAAEPNPPPTEHPFSKTQARTLLEKARAGEAVHLSAQLNAPWPLLGAEIDVGTITTTLVNVRPLDSLEELDVRVAAAGDSEPIQLPLAYEKVIYEFSRWKRTIKAAGTNA